MKVSVIPREQDKSFNRKFRLKFDDISTIDIEVEVKVKTEFYRSDSETAFRFINPEKLSDRIKNLLIELVEEDDDDDEL